MSQENVELALRINDAFNRRDIDAVLALCDPNGEFISRIVELEGGGSYRGHDGIRSWWENLLGVFPDFSSEIEEADTGIGPNNSRNGEGMRPAPPGAAGRQASGWN